MEKPACSYTQVSLYEKYVLSVNLLFLVAKKTKNEGNKEDYFKTLVENYLGKVKTAWYYFTNITFGKNSLDFL